MKKTISLLCVMSVVWMIAFGQVTPSVDYVWTLKTNSVTLNKHERIRQPNDSDEQIANNGPFESFERAPFHFINHDEITVYSNVVAVVKFNDVITTNFVTNIVISVTTNTWQYSIEPAKTNQ